MSNGDDAVGYSDENALTFQKQVNLDNQGRGHPESNNYLVHSHSGSICVCPISIALT